MEFDLTKKFIRFLLVSLILIFILVGLSHLFYSNELERMYFEGIDGGGIGIYRWPVWNEKVDKSQIMNYSFIYKRLGVESVFTGLFLILLLYLTEREFRKPN